MKWCSYTKVRLAPYHYLIVYSLSEVLILEPKRCLLRYVFNDLYYFAIEYKSLILAYLCQKEELLPQIMHVVIYCAF